MDDIDTHNYGWLGHIFHINWMHFVYNDVVWSHMGQPLLSDTIRWWCLSFFGHLCCATPAKNILELFRPTFEGLPKDWRCKTGRPRQTWLRTVEDNLHQLNYSLVMAKQHALDRLTRRQLMAAAMSAW